MRTTIEISDEMRSRLIVEAAKRGERGYSALVERALRAYFELAAGGESPSEAARRLRGCERNETSQELEEARGASVRTGSRTGKTK
jgi:predicted transcriptional regulator